MPEINLQCRGVDGVGSRRLRLAGVRRSRSRAQAGGEKRRGDDRPELSSPYAVPSFNLLMLDMFEPFISSIPSTPVLRRGRQPGQRR